MILTARADVARPFSFCMADSQAPAPLRGRPPLPEGETADSFIHLRCKRRRKSAYVRAANKNGQTLAAWMFDACDLAAGHSE